MSPPLTFDDVVMISWGNKPLVEQFDRLYGTALAKRLSPIDAAREESTGKRKEEMMRFIQFVKDCVWDRCPR